MKTPTRGAARADQTADPVRSARCAGLRYVTDAEPGITRKRAGKHFRFLYPNGSPVTDEAEINRIRALAIPPAYRDVWICPQKNGHLQATGRDARGRKQYRYHPLWRLARDENKYGRMIAFGNAIPAIRRRVAADLALRDMPRDKVIAAVVRLLETTLIRVGNEEYARQNGSFGLTTLRNGHVDLDTGGLRFKFRGKSGKVHEVNLRDRKLAAVVRRCRDLPGHVLFEYVDGDGQIHPVGSEDVNDYLREATGQEFTAKDFRTWAGTVLAAVTLREYGACESEADAKRNVVRAIESVAERLGNTAAVCRKCYVHPLVLELYREGRLIEALDVSVSRPSSPTSLSSEENAVMKMLEHMTNGGK